MKRFYQVPVWEKDTKIEIMGEQFMALRQFFAMFAEPIQVIEEIFKDAIDTEKIKFQFEDEEGKEVSQQEVDTWIEEMEKGESK